MRFLARFVDSKFISSHLLPPPTPLSGSQKFLLDVSVALLKLSPSFLLGLFTENVRETQEQFKIIGHFLFRMAAVAAAVAAATRWLKLTRKVPLTSRGAPGHTSRPLSSGPALRLKPRPLPGK